MTTPQPRPEPLLTDSGGWEPPPRAFPLRPLATSGIALLVVVVAFVSLRAVWTREQAAPLEQDWGVGGVQHATTAESSASPWQPVYSSPVRETPSEVPAAPHAPHAPLPSPPRRLHAAPEPEHTSVPGYLAVNSTPWAEVSVDGIVVGNTPQLRIQVRPGRHEVVLRRAGFDTHHTVVSVASGATLRITGIVLKRSTP